MEFSHGEQRHPMNEDHSTHLLFPTEMHDALLETADYLTAMDRESLDRSSEPYTDADKQRAEDYARTALIIIKKKLDPEGEEYITPIMFEDIVAEIEQDEVYQLEEARMKEAATQFLEWERSLEGSEDIEEVAIPGDRGIDLFRDAFAETALDMALTRRWLGVPPEEDRY